MKTSQCLACVFEVAGDAVLSFEVTFTDVFKTMAENWVMWKQ